MNNNFSGFYRFSDDDYVTAWREGVFVLDASFLCGLYRLPTGASDELLAVLKTISDRLWVPHHAALEFQRNRLSVIADQKHKFHEIRCVFDKTKKVFSSGLSKLELKRRHSLIRQDTLEHKFNGLFQSFEAELADNESKQIDVCDDDPLLSKIDELLDGKIGPPPVDQAEIDEFYKEAKNRYENKVPPGFLDSSKQKDKEPVHTYDGITYQRQYGDFVVWKQLLAHAKSAELKLIILLTNDIKEDWFWRVRGESVGPQPELRNEIFRVSGVTLFHIVTAERFLSVSPKYLGVKVSEDSVKAAKDIWQLLRQPRVSRGFPSTGTFPEQIVEEMLPDLSSVLVNEDDTVSSEMAITNALGYGLDTYEVLSAGYDPESDLIEFKADIHLAGEQDQDMGFCGDSIDITLSGQLRYSNGSWEVHDYEIESCKVSDY